MAPTLAETQYARGKPKKPVEIRKKAAYNQNPTLVSNADFHLEEGNVGTQSKPGTLEKIMAGSTRNRSAGSIMTSAEATSPRARDTRMLPDRRIAPWGAREVMDIRQAAEYLGISPDSLYKYASENFIPAFKLGNRWRFKRSLLESWMEQKSSLSLVPIQEKSVKSRQKKPVGRAR